MKINITQLSNCEFNVTVINKVKTNHLVKLSDDSFTKLTNGKLSKEKLILLSFEFLLLRESNTSILKTFELSQISNYFPEYSRKVSDWSSK